MFERLGNLAAYDLLGLAPGSAPGDAVQFFIMDVAKIFVLLVAVIYVMGLLRALLSPERVRAFVCGRPDWQARGLAVTLGALTPFCSCSSVPLFIGFVEAGIPLGVTFSFLIASPMINEVAAVILVGILGWKLAALYVAAGLLVAWFGGIAMQAFRPERWVDRLAQWSATTMYGRFAWDRLAQWSATTPCWAATVTPLQRSRRSLDGSGDGC
jgi:uncharacterized membrane protein YraQ (UPF0718 family)